MPLSEHEQKILAELEESLSKQDPRFAKNVRDTNVYSHGARRVRWGIAGFVLGLVVLLAFFSQNVYVGLVGVALMFASAIVIERNARLLGRAGWRDITQPHPGDDATGLAVAVDGDVRALALAEGRFGAGRGIDNYASLVVSTGVGGALVMDGRLLDGDSGNSGHIGHLNVVPDGRQCSCGARGCLEAEVSGWAIQEITGKSPQFADEDLRRRAATLVGRAVGTLASVLDLNHCFVAGSVALGYGGEFFTTATASAREMATMHFSRSLEIRPSGLGPDGPILGAACVAWRSES